MRWLSAIAGCDSTKCASASGPKGPTVAVGGVVGVEGEAEVELETNLDRIIDRGIMAGAAEVEPSVVFQSFSCAKVLISFAPASAISLSYSFSLASNAGPDTFQ